MSHRLFRPLLIAIGAVALMAGGAGIAAGSIRSHHAPTHAVACVNATGVLVLSSNGTCGKGLTRVSLPLSAVRGPRGPRGARGRVGPAGTNGTNGTNGNNGAQGPTGIGTGAIFGDGSDGNVTVTTNTTLSRDMYYDNLTLESGVMLNPGGFRIFVRGTLTFDNGSSIAANGNDASGDTGGAALAAGTLGGSGFGSSTAAGAGESEANSLGGNGGDDAAGAGGAGGTATPPSAAGGGANVFRDALAAISGRSLDGVVVTGGAGGTNFTAEGAGGGGGGVVVVAAVAVAVNGTAQVSANGGSGAFVSGVGNSGGGGGGGGGVVVVISDSSQPSGLTLNAQGGAPGLDAQAGGSGFTDWLN